MLADEKARFDDLHYYNGQDIIVTLPTPMTGLATNSFPFRENSLICLEGKSMTPLRENTILFRSSQQLPRLRLGPLKGFLS